MDPVADEIERARNAILDCEYEQAVTACREVLSRFPRHVEATCLLAEAYREQGQRGPAEDLLRRVLSADPENVLAYWALGLLLRDLGREEEAFTWLTCAREIAPGNAELVSDMLSVAPDPRSALKPTRSLLGRYYAAAGLYERAAAEFRGVLAEKPRRLDIWVALAEALWRDGSQDEAAAVCEAILAESPHCVKPLTILAKVRQAEGESETAHDLLTLVQELDPAGSTLAKLS